MDAVDTHFPDPERCNDIAFLLDDEWKKDIHEVCFWSCQCPIRYWTFWDTRDVDKPFLMGIESAAASESSTSRCNWVLCFARLRGHVHYRQGHGCDWPHWTRDCKDWRFHWDCWYQGPGSIWNLGTEQGTLWMAPCCTMLHPYISSGLPKCLCDHVSMCCPMETCITISPNKRQPYESLTGQAHEGQHCRDRDVSQDSGWRTVRRPVCHSEAANFVRIMGWGMSLFASLSMDQCGFLLRCGVMLKGVKRNEIQRGQAPRSV